MAAADVGMPVKMNVKCFPGIRDLAAGRPCDEAPIHRLLDFVDARHDCADFRLVCLLFAYAAYRPLLTPETAARIRRSALAFKYAMDEPGSDGMCFWSENHQLLFSACAFVAGGLFPEDVFTNSGLTGMEQRAKARLLILRWSGYRFRFGFNEFHSNTYYEEDVAPLCLLFDHGGDETVRLWAATLLDLLFLDMALHSFQGRFVAASGRCYEAPKKDAAAADVNDLLDAAFFGFGERAPDFTRIAALFHLSTYRVPAAICAIARDQGPLVVRDSMGLDLAEVKRAIPSRAFDDRGLYLWAMEAFTNRESIELTIDMFRAWNLRENNFLADLRKVDIPLLRKLRLLPLVVRVLNPATQGVAIERADTYTRKTPEGMLSVAQRHHPGSFGDQQHLWQVTLPGGVNVFSTHPGSPMFDDPARNFSPSYWVGNGINPHLAAADNVLLLAYDLRGRRGFLERERQPFVHFHFPEARFDATTIRPRFVAGRAGDGYVAIRADVEGTLHDSHDLVFPGLVSHFAVVVGSSREHGSFAAFVDAVAAAPFSTASGRTTFSLGRVYGLDRRRGLTVDGQATSTAYPRLDCPYGFVPRDPTRYEIVAGGHRLTLAPGEGIRQETSDQEGPHGS